jgi:TonB family protein
MKSGFLVLALSLATAAFAQDMKKVSKAEALSAATLKPQPEYPANAKQFKVSGKVNLEAVVTESGTVEAVNILDGNPMLTRAAADALKKWKFTPFTADGKPVKTVAPVAFDFVL